MAFLDQLFDNTSRRGLRLAKEMVRQRSALVDLTRQSEALTKKDIASWHQAWQMAIHPEEPRRGALYDCYTTALIDNHLQGCIAQRKGRTLQKEYILKNRAGREDDRAKGFFANEWFVQLMDFALDARLWGHSLVQMGDVVQPPGGAMRFEGCTLVPRKHVIQEYGVITREVGHEWRRGICYREGELADWCIEVGAPHDLGLLLGITPQCISKKNMLAYWDTFGEVFGMPLRVGKTPSQDRRDWTVISAMLEKLGAAGWLLVPEGTEIDIKETSRGDAFNVYDRRVERCNSEVSKAVLGQTMTIDSGASLSQSETHLEVFNNICRGDATAIKHVINNRLIPLMVKHGFPLAGCVFDWDEAAGYTPSERREQERMLLEHYDINPQYFIDRYKIDITGVKKQRGTDFFE